MSNHNCDAGQTALYLWIIAGVLGVITLAGTFIYREGRRAGCIAASKYIWNTTQENFLNLSCSQVLNE